ITAYDLSCGDPKAGTKVGSATFVPPPNPAKPWIPDPATGIVQHFTNPVLPLQPGPEAVATAVIEAKLLPAGYKEDVSSDLRIEISRNGTTIVDKNYYYDVTTVPGPVPATASFPSLPTSDVGVYLKLPRPLQSGLASLDLSDDGSPPNYKT